MINHDIVHPCLHSDSAIVSHVGTIIGSWLQGQQLVARQLCLMKPYHNTMNLSTTNGKSSRNTDMQCLWHHNSML